MIVGRMKFCRDIFRSVNKVDHDLAVKSFEGKKQAFHPIARKLIEKVGLFCSVLMDDI
jgi:leukotriene-A4 hydrolase